MHFLCCGGESIFGYGSKNCETPVTLCSACEVLISISVSVYRHLAPSSGSSLKKQCKRSDHRSQNSSSYFIVYYCLDIIIFNINTLDFGFYFIRTLGHVLVNVFFDFVIIIIIFKYLKLALM